MVYCFLADGFEEVEALAAVDMIRRAGIELRTVGVGSTVINGAHNIRVEADCTENDVILDGELEAVILPGGMPGTINLENSTTVRETVDFAFNNNKYVCAICAAPSVLGHMGILKGKEAIAYPGFEKDLEGAIISEKSVVSDGNIITAKGAGVAVDFGLEIVAALSSPEKAESIRKAIQSK